MKKRIWELDVLRGIFMIAIIFFHLMYDLIYLFGIVELTTPLAQKLYQFGNDWGGTPFLFLSGLCATIGSRPGKRAFTVLAGGIVISLVTTATSHLMAFSIRSPSPATAEGSKAVRIPTTNKAMVITVFRRRMVSGTL